MVRSEQEGVVRKITELPPYVSPFLEPIKQHPIDHIRR